MSLFIIGSVSRVTSNIVLQLARNAQYSRITIADLLPRYEFHHRYYRLQRELEQTQSQTKLDLIKISFLDDLQKQATYDDLLFVTHDYYQAVTSKTKLMELTAQTARHRKNLYFATPAEYDHFGYQNPEANYLEYEEIVQKINPNATILRSQIQDKN